MCKAGYRVSGNFPEIGRSALCADLREGRLFREHEPFGEVRPKDENTVVVSVCQGSGFNFDNEEEKLLMMGKIASNAREILAEALKNRMEKNHNEEREQKQEQSEHRSIHRR